MPSEGGPVRAVLYARVSTAKQEKEGYSLGQQLERLREFAADEGYEVVEEITDPGKSGATLERPGLDRVRDLVASGGVDIVLAQDRDRLAREPAYLYLLRKEFAARGTALKALNDHGGDGPEGDLTNGILDQLAKFERAKTAERSRRGKLAKAKQGKVVGGHGPSYGFSYDKPRGAYVVDEEKMQVVKRIFREIASGTPIRTLKTMLDTEGVPTPGGGAGWSRPFIKSLILDDLYLPHSVDELHALGVSEQVLDGLEPGSAYGVYRYRDTPVPIPDAGIEREVVMAARERVKDNRSPSRAGGRFWELSGGILRCGECGRAMQTHTTGYNDRTYTYYRCQCLENGRRDPCPNRRKLRAEETEQKVVHATLDTFRDPEPLVREVERAFEPVIKDIARSTEAAAGACKRLEAIQSARANYQRAYAADAISLADLKDRTGELDEEQRDLERLLKEHEGREGLEAALSQRREAMIEDIRHSDPREFAASSPWRRHEHYRQLGLRVDAYADHTLRISWGLGHELSLGKNETSPSQLSTPRTLLSRWIG